MPFCHPPACVFPFSTARGGCRAVSPRHWHIMHSLIWGPFFAARAALPLFCGTRGFAWNGSHPATRSKHAKRARCDVREIMGRCRRVWPRFRGDHVSKTKQVVPPSTGFLRKSLKVLECPKLDWYDMFGLSIRWPSAPRIGVDAMLNIMYLLFNVCCNRRLPIRSTFNLKVPSLACFVHLSTCTFQGVS